MAQEYDETVMLEKNEFEAAAGNFQADNMIFYPDYSQNESVRCFFIFIYLVIIVLAVLGNALVLLTCARQKKSKNSLDFLMCSLAVSDLMVGALVAPAKLLELVAPADLRFFGDALCTCLLFTQSLTIFSSIITLLLVAAERYLVIVHPLRARRWKKKLLMRLLLIGSWLSAFILSAPSLSQARHSHLYLYSQYGTQHRAGCSDRFDQLIHVHFRYVIPFGQARLHDTINFQAYFLFLFIMLYMLPILAIALFNGRVVMVLFSRNNCDVDILRRSEHLRPDEAMRKQLGNRRKIAIMMITVNVAFIVSWSPYFLTTIVTQYFCNFFEEGHFYFTMLCINACGFLNSAVNPIIYLLVPCFRRNYRSSLRFLLSCCGTSYSNTHSSCSTCHCHARLCRPMAKKTSSSGCTCTCPCRALHHTHSSTHSSFSQIPSSCRSTTSSLLTSSSYYTTRSTGNSPELPRSSSCWLTVPNSRRLSTEPGMTRPNSIGHHTRLKYSVPNSPRRRQLSLSSSNAMVLGGELVAIGRLTGRQSLDWLNVLSISKSGDIPSSWRVGPKAGLPDQSRSFGAHHSCQYPTVISTPTL